MRNGAIAASPDSTKRPLASGLAWAETGDCADDAAVSDESTRIPLGLRALQLVQPIDVRWVCRSGAPVHVAPLQIEQSQKRKTTNQFIGCCQSGT